MPRRYSDKQIADALRAANGGMYLASQRLGCAYNTIRRRVDNNPKLQAIVEEMSTKMIDWAESKLFQAVQNGEPWAITLVLKTKGKNRGYVERTEQVIELAMRREAEAIASQYGLNPDDVLRTAEQILSEAQRD